MLDKTPDLNDVTRHSEELRRESRKSKTPARSNCFVCERYTKVEFDHPVPQAAKGNLLVPLCLACHEDLDRTPLEKWDSTDALTGLMSLWQRSGQNERLLILKMVRVVAHGQALIEKQSEQLSELSKQGSGGVV